MSHRLDIMITILDLPDILEIFEESLAAVPDWERQALQERLGRLIERARRHPRRN